MRIRLGPGGKILLVLLGLGVILGGLEFYGLLDVIPGWGTEDGTPAEAPAVAARDAEPVPPRPRPVPAEDLRELRAADEGTRVERGGAGVERPEAERGGGMAGTAAGRPTPSDEPGARGTGRAGPGRVAPPPLMGEAPEPLALGGDTVWQTRLAADTALRALEVGDLDLAPVEPAALANAGVRARPVVVVGALPPLSPRWLCAREDPLRFLRAGMTIHAVGPDRLLAAHVAEAKGIEADALTFVSEGSADLAMRGQAPPGENCLNLAEVGAQTRRLVLARAEDARLFGGDYREAAERVGALAPEAVAWLTAPAVDPRGYAAYAAYLADLAARLDGGPWVEPPEVATWIVHTPGRGGEVGELGSAAAVDPAARSGEREARPGEREARPGEREARP